MRLWKTAENSSPEGRDSIGVSYEDPRSQKRDPTVRRGWLGTLCAGLEGESRVGLHRATGLCGCRNLAHAWIRDP
jgi:hypothetical protein